MRAWRGALLGGVAVLATACWEHVAAPGNCPAFCPSGQIQIVDTILPAIISRDSAFRGYVGPNQVSTVVLAANLPTVDGRTLFRFIGHLARWPHILGTSDTTTGAILGADSARLHFTVSRRDTAAHNLTLRLYRLPITIDTSTTFASTLPFFADSLLLHTVNIDTLLARPGRTDSVTGDSARVDTLLHVLTLSLKLDSTKARYVSTDSGTVAYGLRVAADSFASIAIAKNSFALQWYLRVDSAQKSVARATANGTYFASFVFNPPPPALDSTLAVGGVPSARSLLRVAFPRFIRDSSSVIRGTLTLLPAMAARGAHSDSFIMEAHTVYADYGAKSPVILDATRSDTTTIRIGATDTVRIEVTNVLQYWAADTTRPTALVLRAQSEGQSFAWISFYPSVATAFRPALHITFLRRFPFGVP